jgi:hypothetical protein
VADATTCGCHLGYEDCDSALLWSEGRVTATKKPHKCYECHDEIPAGSRCCKASWMQARGERWTTAYRCATCAALAEYVALTNGACPLWGGLSESCDGAGVDWGWFRRTGQFAEPDEDEEEE